MGAQEIFDKVARHLRDQNCQSLSSDGCRCLYRGYDGTKCAIGVLLDDHEAAKLEGNGIAFNNAPFRLKQFCNGLLQALQLTHDGMPVAIWPQSIANIANTYSLKSDHLVKSNQWIPNA